MGKPGPIDRERELVRRLRRLAEQCSSRQTEAEALCRDRMAAAEAGLIARHRELAERFQAEQTSLAQAYETGRAAAAERFSAGQRAERKRYSVARRRLAVDHEDASGAARAAFRFTAWKLRTSFERGKRRGCSKYEMVARRIEADRARLAVARAEAEHLLAPWNIGPKNAGPEADAAEDSGAAKPLARLRQAVEQAEAGVDGIRRSLLRKLCQGNRVLALAVVIGAAATAPGWGTDRWLHWLIGGTAAGVLGGLLLFAWAAASVRSRARRFDGRLTAAESLARRCDAVVNAKRDAVTGRLAARYESASRRLHRRSWKLVLQADVDLAHRRRAAERAHVSQTAACHEQLEAESAALRQQYPALQAESRARYEKNLQEVGGATGRALEEARRCRDEVTVQSAAAWVEGVRWATAEAQELWRTFEVSQPGWAAFAEGRPAASEMPDAVRFGTLTLPLARLPGSVPDNPELRRETTESITLPGLVPFPEAASAVWAGAGDAVSDANAALRAVLFRVLTAVPPGQARVTVIDHVGLGHDFGAFMHLADFQESLVTQRVWSDPADIEQRLTELTAHIETVLQKHLRDQFETIADYNSQAGELAEPYRFLVVSNFPAGFSGHTAERLLAVARTGARCGVFTLVTVDRALPLPQGFDLAELERHAVSFSHEDGGWRWRDPDFGEWPFQFDSLPAEPWVAAALQELGRRARLANRVEVPFASIAPPEDRWWSQDSGEALEIPLGRSGATRHVAMRLGKGTSQHVLVAGKTGSGKSTLFHALITDACLRYSPEELELYLVDFKEGVEFKPYATHGLPHARVVAIESEREFGLSVLQRLEQELRVRGDLFRQKGVQDLKSFRQLPGAPKLPRVLLIVDEFQVFFIEEDRIAQDAALLLDRLVRQGRAFGLHVILGSQTLGGAYSLARSTMGQMTVRVALQCSEADANLILNEDNPAAKWLERPGEAIYNEASGAPDANEIFQVVWLSDEARGAYLAALANRAARAGYTPPAPQVVFEGNAGAELERNESLARLLSAGPPAREPEAARAWLGEAVAIKEPTAAAFAPQSGSNLLLVGQNEEPARGVISAALLGLAAQLPTGTIGDGLARFTILDGTAAQSPDPVPLGRLADALPQDARVAGWREVAATINGLAAEVERRAASPDASAPSLFLVVFGLQRFRDLRPPEDEFGFSRRGEDEVEPPAQRFRTVLRDGPGVGVFTLVWCDNLNNLNRFLDRQALREFEMRVLFQMSANDSGILIDSPAAANLGAHRALFTNADLPHPERFRPYRPPAPESLERLRAALARSGPAQPMKSEPSPVV